VVDGKKHISLCNQDSIYIYSELQFYCMLKWCGWSFHFIISSSSPNSVQMSYNHHLASVIVDRCPSLAFPIKLFSETTEPK
jgi:hypothetical protein